MTNSKQPDTDPKPAVNKPQSPAKPAIKQEQAPGEVGGPNGLEPTRYGDWERKGIISDF